MKALSRSLLLLASLFAFAGAVNAQPAMFVEGTHYQELPNPVRTADPAKIEVTEVFWYGCPHCYAFEPLIDSWKQQQADDVAFVYNPGMWNEMMETHAQIYYAAEALDVLDKIHPAAFDAIHQRGNYLQTPAAVKELFVNNGVSAEDFDKAWSSFTVTSKTKQAGTRMREYGVRGVPALIVNGKYMVSAGGPVATQADMLKVADFLIQKERAAN